MKIIKFMIGLSGSYRSDYCLKEIQRNCGFLVSTDLIQNEYKVTQNEAVRMAISIIYDIYISNKNFVVYFDSPNLIRKQRIDVLNNLKRKMKDVTIDCILVATPFEKCKNGVEKEYLSFIPPTLNEGYNSIKIEWDNRYSYNEYDVYRFINDTKEYDQNNKHHKLTLGEHLMKCAKYVKSKKGDDKLLWFVSLIHDCGKNKTAIVGKDLNTHFYHHENVGSYDGMFYLKNSKFTDDEVLYGINLIYSHMLPHRDWVDSKTKMNKDLKLMDKRFFDDLMILHYGDLNAH